MKIQKTLLYGLAVVGGIVLIMYLTKGSKSVMADGGAMPPVTPPVTPPITPPIV